MNIISSLLILSILQFVTLAGHAWANDAPLQLMSGGVGPLYGREKGVRMDSEEVTIKLGDDRYVVDATFRLTNRGETKTMLVGFPKKGVGYLGGFEKVAEFFDFKTWVNGTPVEFTEEGGASQLRATDKTLPDLVASLKAGEGGNLFAEDIRWHVKWVTFPRGKTTITRVRYEAPYNDNVPCGSAYYIYGTGSFWDGKIGKATFVIETARKQGGLPQIHMPRNARKTRLSKATVKYTITNFEPAENAQIVIYPCPPP